MIYINDADQLAASVGVGLVFGLGYIRRANCWDFHLERFRYPTHVAYVFWRFFVVFRCVDSERRNGGGDP